MMSSYLSLTIGLLSVLPLGICLFPPPYPLASECPYLKTFLLSSHYVVDQCLCCTTFVFQLLVMLRNTLGRRNLAEKTLVEKQFLI